MPARAEITLRRDRDLWRGAFTAMANPCEVLCYGEQATAAAMVEIVAEEAWRIERKFSRYRDDSVVHVLNTARGKPVTLDDESAQLIDYAATLWQLSAGAFDISSGVLRHAWRFGEAQRAPQVELIQALLQRVGWQRAHWRKPMLTLPATMEIDLGGIGKEYAVDRAVALLARWPDTPALINFGGDLRSAGPAPAHPWQVGIEAVQNGASNPLPANLIKLTSGALATSGDTHRYLEIDGQRYGHILDARTGWPAIGAPRSVTVAADTCTQAGTFSTLAMLQGAQAEQFLAAEGVQFWCLR